MKKQNSLLGILFVGMLILMIIAIIIDEPHEHKTYEYPYANGARSITFTICGDSSLVTKDTGNHLPFIPSHFEPFVEENNRIK